MDGIIKLGIFEEPTLIGREKELELLQQYFEYAKAGKGTTVFIIGEAGSGKTRIVNEFLNVIQKNEPIAVLTGWSQSDISIAYLPFVEALSSYFLEHPERSKAESELCSLLKGPDRLNLEKISPQAWKDQTFDAVRKTLATICVEKPAILFLDDIQWADSASLELLHYISRSMANARLLILATCRSEDLTQSSKGQPNKFSEYLRLIRRASNFREVTLSGLNLANISLLAEQMVGGSIQSSFARKLGDESQGNPLFIVESLRMLSEKQSLVNDNNKWDLIQEEIGLPTRIKDIILLRVAKLNAEQRELLDVASVIGAKFDPDLLAKVLAKSSTTVIEILNAINQSTLLVVCEGANYRFDHAKSKDALYDELSVGQRKVYHYLIGQKLESSPSPYLQISDLAYHYSQAENREKAIKYSLAAGQKALSFLLGSEAIKQFTHVLDLTADNTQTPERDIAFEGLGDGYFIAANAEAINVFQRLSEETVSPVVKVRSLRKAARASLVQGNYGLALEIVQKTPDFTSIDKLEGARFLLMKGMVEAWGGFMPDALNDLQIALRVFETQHSLPDVIDALIELSIAYMEKSPESNLRLSQPENAIASVLRALALCEYTKDVGKQFYGLIVGFVICVECDLENLAKQLLKENTKIIQKLGDSRSKDSNEPWNRWVSGYMTEISVIKKFFTNYSTELIPSTPSTTDLKSSTLADDLEAAIEEGKAGVKLAEEGEFFEIQGLLYGNLAREYAMLGQMEQANEYYNKLEKVFTETTLSGFLLARILYLYSKALYNSFQHRWDVANRFFEDSIDYYSSMRPGTGIEATVRRWYSYALLQQEKPKDAERQLEGSKAILIALEKRFSDADILANLLAPSKVQLNKEFDLNLDIINVAMHTRTVLQILDILPLSFEVVSAKPLISFRDGTAKMEPIQIGAFQVKTCVFSVKATSPGVFRWNPQIIYKDNFVQDKKLVPEQVEITVDAILLKAQPEASRPIISQDTHSGSKPFDVFLCYKQSSGKDFADHLKSGLEELGLHTFLDSKDIPQFVEHGEGWAKARDNALLESKHFVLIMTPGFDLSTEVIKEIGMARKETGKIFVFFRHRKMGRKIILNLEGERLDIGQLEQVSFESKEELMRLAHGILIKSR